MIRDTIPGFNRSYTLEELISVEQYKNPYDVLDENNIPYYKEIYPEKLKGEEFKTAFIYCKYPVEVSTFGRIRYRKMIVKQEDNIKNHPNGGWLWLECPEFSSLHHKYVYQLVTDTWLGPNPGNKKDGYYERHHINNNGYDNRVTNLIWLTAEEHKKIPRPSTIKEN